MNEQMKRIMVVLLGAMLVTVALTGCKLLGMGTKGPEYTLPADPVVVAESTYVNPEDDEDEYLSIEYNGRVYIPYGNLDVRAWSGIERTCVGYVERDNDADTNNRLLTLAGTEDYLMTYYINGMMEQPMFYRAVDTAGQAIYTPDYISMVNEGNHIWENVTQEDWDDMDTATKKFMKLSGVNLVGGEVQGLVDTHGGFQNDGYKVIILKFSQDDLSEALAAGEHWQKLPLSADLDGYLQACTFKDGTDAIPDGLANGYYFYFNRVSDCADHYDEREGFAGPAINFTAGIWDAGKNMMYIIVFDI